MADEPRRIDDGAIEIEHTAIGDEGRPARQEYIGLFVYIVSMAGFLAWLLVYGVNV